MWGVITLHTRVPVRHDLQEELVRERRREEERDFSGRPSARPHFPLSCTATRDEGPEAEQCFDVFAGPQLVTSGAAHVGKQRFEGEKIGVGGHAVLASRHRQQGFDKVLGGIIIVACV